MSHKQRSTLVQVNRTLIFLLTLLAMAMDGLTAADGLLTVALVVWLWLPQIARMEVRILEQVDGKSRFSAIPTHGPAAAGRASVLAHRPEENR